MYLQWITGGFQSLQLDIVGLLAILGESSVLANAQVASLSRYFLLPRLIPAPQALFRTARPERLTPSKGKVVGTNSGGITDHVNYVANLLHDGNKLPAYSVRCIHILKDESKPPVKARALGPLAILSVLGCAMSVALLVLSIIKKDGMALLATILLSMLATLVGIGSRWSLELKKRTANRKVPNSDVVISYPHGAFLIVKCSEEIARELYFAPEECHYKFGPTAYRILSLVASIMLMFGVIFLGNAGLILQMSFAGAYLILNAAYWTVAALPQQWNWDLSCFDVKKIKYSTGQKYTGEKNAAEKNAAEKKAAEKNAGEENETFTAALWQAIAITQSTEWAINAQIAPISPAWRQWLRAAGEEAGAGDPNKKDQSGRIILPKWDPEKALKEFLNPGDVMDIA